MRLTAPAALGGTQFGLHGLQVRLGLSGTLLHRSTERFEGSVINNKVFIRHIIS